MPPSPYRDAANRAERRDPRTHNRDLSIPLAIFWLLSALRVAGAVIQHETFGVSATLAVVAVLVVPFALRRPR